MSREQYLQERRAYWESVYIYNNGMRRVPCPIIECYSEEGEIITNPAFVALAHTKIETPFLNLIPRSPVPALPVIEWKRITAYFSDKEQSDEPTP